MANFWLVKSEPNCFSWQDLLDAPRQTTCWDGVRNYQARNFLRDGMCLGDFVFFYQSCAKPLAVVGCMRVVKQAYPDPSQFMPDHDAFDAGSTTDAPRWFAVDMQAEQTLPKLVTLAQMRTHPDCAQLALLQKGTRLSVIPVDKAAAHAILAMAAG